MKISRDQLEFILATKNAEIEKLEIYLNNGLDINCTDKNGKTGILIATEQENTDMVRWFVDNGADINHRGSSNEIIDNTPFLYAGANGLDDILKILIPHNPDVTILNRYGGNALIPACERGHVSTVQLLLEKTNVDVNLINNLGWTALLEAIILSDGGKDHQDIVKLLLLHGANVNIPDNEGTLPVEHAEKKGFREIVKLINNHITSFSK